MPDLEMIEIQEVEAKIGVLSSQDKASLDNTPKRSPRFEPSRQRHSANWIAERVAVAFDGQLANGSLPA